MKEPVYPGELTDENISSIFVDESARGHRLSGLLIEAAETYARSLGFKRVYIPSDIVGLYEKYGYKRIDELMNYGGDMDQIFMKEI